MNCPNQFLSHFYYEPFSSFVQDIVSDLYTSMFKKSLLFHVLSAFGHFEIHGVGQLVSIHGNYLL